MACDDRPQNEACNCCGDEEIRSLIQELTSKIHEVETLIKELADKPYPLPQYTDCGGLPLANNAMLATCSDLSSAISGIKIPDIPDIPDISGLNNRISHLESEIARLNTLISNLNTLNNNPGRDNNFGGRVDKATIDGLIQQIQNIDNRFSGTNDRLNEFQLCCDELRQEIAKLKEGSGGGDCDYNGWSVDVQSRFVQHNEPDYGRRFEAIIRGPKLKSVTVLSNTNFQRTVVTSDSGSIQIHWEEKPLHNTSYSGIVRLIHCGREVAQTNVIHV